MTIPDNIDLDRLDDYTDEQLLELLLEADFAQARAEYTVEILRGRVSERVI